MKRNEVLEKYADELIAEIKDMHDRVVACEGSILYRLYVWEDGEIEWVEDVPGGRARLRAKDGESRELFYVTTISMPEFCWQDFCNEPVPDEKDGPDGYMMLKLETMDWLMADFEASKVLENAMNEEDM